MGRSLYFAPSPLPAKRPRFGDGAMGDDDGSDGEGAAAGGARLCTLAPHGVDLSSEDGAPCSGAVDPSGWVVVGSGSGRVAAWEVHHVLPGEAARAPRFAFAYKAPALAAAADDDDDGGGGSSGGGAPALACLLPPAVNGSRGVAACGGSGSLAFWPELRSQQGGGGGGGGGAVEHNLPVAASDRIKALVALSPGVLAAATDEGRLFRVSCNGRLREVGSAECLRRAQGWRAALSSVVFGGAPARFAALRPLVGGGGVLLVTARGVSAWGGPGLDFGAELPDFADAADACLRRAAPSRTLGPAVLADAFLTAPARGGGAGSGGGAWFLVVSPDDGGDAALSLHRVGVAGGGGALEAHPRDGADHLLLVDLALPGGGGRVEPPAGGTWRLVEPGGAAGSKPAFLACADPDSGEVWAIFEHQAGDGGGGGGGRGSWGRTAREGPGFATARFVQRFPDPGAPGLSPGGRGALACGVIGALLVVTAADGRTFMLEPLDGAEPAAEPAAAAAAAATTTTTTTTTTTSSTASAAAAAAFGALGRAHIHAGSASEWGAALRAGFEAQGLQGTVASVAACLAPVREALVSGGSGDGVSAPLAAAVVGLSLEVCNGSFDGSSLVHHALSRKVAEHGRLCKFLDEFCFKPLHASHRRADVAFIGAMRAARVEVACHGQQLAGAAALRDHVARLASTADQPGGGGRGGGGAAVGGGGGALAVAQRGLARVASERKGPEALRAQRLATGLGDVDVFYEAPAGGNAGAGGGLAAGLAAMVAEACALGGSGGGGGGVGAEGRMAALLCVASCVGAALGAAQRAFHPLVQSLDSPAPGGAAAASLTGGGGGGSGGLAGQTRCFTGSGAVRRLLLDLVRGLHTQALRHAPYSSASAASGGGGGGGAAARVEAQLAAALDLLLLGGEVGGVASPGLAPLLLAGFRERGGADASGDSGGGAYSYHGAKAECFAPLLTLVLALAPDGDGWAFLAGKLEALCLAHDHFEGLHELALIGEDRFGKAARGGLGRLAELAALVGPANTGTGGASLAALAIGRLGGDTASGAGGGGSGAVGRAARPADALRLGAAVTGGGGPNGCPEALAALVGPLGPRHDLKWLDDLRRGLGLAYDPAQCAFVAPAGSGSGSGGSGSAAALGEGTVTLLARAGDAKGFATRKTLTSLAKLAALAGSPDSAWPPRAPVPPESQGYAPVSPFHPKRHSPGAPAAPAPLAAPSSSALSASAARRAEVGRWLREADMGLALLQVQEQLHGSLPTHLRPASQGTGSQPAACEPPAVLVDRVIAAMRGARATPPPLEVVRHVMVALALLDTMAYDDDGDASFTGSRSSSSSSSSGGGGGGCDDWEAGDASAFYLGTQPAGGGREPVLLELRVDSGGWGGDGGAPCGGEGLTPRGRFLVGPGSAWDGRGSYALRVLPEGGSRTEAELRLKDSGLGGPGRSLEEVGPDGTTTVTSRSGGGGGGGGGTVLHRVGRHAAASARRQLESRGLATKLWAAVVRHGDEEAGAAGGGSAEGSASGWSGLAAAAAEQGDAFRCSGAFGEEAVRGRFAQTLLFAVASAQAGALAAGEFSAPQLRLRWRGFGRSAAAPVFGSPGFGRAVAAAGAGLAEDGAEALSGAVCLEDLGLDPAGCGSPACLALLKKCLTSAADP